MKLNARRLCVVATLALFCGLSAILIGQTSTPERSSALSDVEIRQVLIERIDRQHQSLGMVVGIVAPMGRRVVAHGIFDGEDPREVTGDTVFEIGSVTKVFTAWLLSEMTHRGEVNLTDPVSRYLPPGMSAKPTSDDRTITLADLATHTAGFPFWPPNVAATGDTMRALATYTVDQLFEFVSAYDVPADVGKKWAYSNVDAGLLGVLLARRAGTSYEELLASRLTSTLAMTNTAVTPSSAMRSRLAIGHDAQLQRARPWNVPALAGGGSLHSTLNDLLRFLSALGDPHSAVSSPLSTMLATRRQGPGFQQALGWMVLSSAGADDIVFHDGQTLGYASSIVYEPATRTGVVVLSNTAAGVGDLARHVLRPSMPLAKPAAPAPRRTEIQVDPQIFDRYAGRYEPAPGTAFVVSREADSLMLQLPGLPKLRLRPESEREFFVAENTRISVTFEMDADGQVTRLLLRAPTGIVPAVRVKR